MDDVRPPCEECELLQKEEIAAWDSLQRQRNMNRLSALAREEAAKATKRLEEAYLRAGEKLRRHKRHMHRSK